MGAFMFIINSRISECQAHALHPSINMLSSQRRKPVWVKAERKNLTLTCPGLNVFWYQSSSTNSDIQEISRSCILSNSSLLWASNLPAGEYLNLSTLWLLLHFQNGYAVPECSVKVCGNWFGLEEGIFWRIGTVCLYSCCGSCDFVLDLSHWHLRGPPGVPRPGLSGRNISGTHVWV